MKQEWLLKMLEILENRYIRADTTSTSGNVRSEKKRKERELLESGGVIKGAAGGVRRRGARLSGVDDEDGDSIARPDEDDDEDELAYRRRLEREVSADVADDLQRGSFYGETLPTEDQLMRILQGVACLDVNNENEECAR